MKGKKIYGISYEEIVVDYQEGDRVYELYHTDAERTKNEIVALFREYNDAYNFFEDLEPSSVVMGDKIIITAYNLLEYNNYDNGDYEDFECIDFNYEEL